MANQRRTVGQALCGECGCPERWHIPEVGNQCAGCGACTGFEATEADA